MIELWSGECFVSYLILSSVICLERLLNIPKTVAFPAEILTEDIPHTKRERYAFYRDVRQNIHKLQSNIRRVLHVICFLFIL